MYKRIMVAATGSKMQTVGLFFAKTIHPDIHTEYPVPDSYFIKGMSSGIRSRYEIVISDFSELFRGYRVSSYKYKPQRHEWHL